MHQKREEQKNEHKQTLKAVRIELEQREAFRQEKKKSSELLLQQNNKTLAEMTTYYENKIEELEKEVNRKRERTTNELNAINNEIDVEHDEFEEEHDLLETIEENQRRLSEVKQAHAQELIELKIEQHNNWINFQRGKKEESDKLKNLNGEHKEAQNFLEQSIQVRDKKLENLKLIEGCNRKIIAENNLSLPKIKTAKVSLGIIERKITEKFIENRQITKDVKKLRADLLRTVYNGELQTEIEKQKVKYILKKMNETVVKLRREAALIENKLSTFKSLAVNILDGRTKYELWLLDAIDHVCERERKDVDKLEIDYLEEIFQHIMSKVNKNEDWPNWRVDFSAYDE